MHPGLQRSAARSTNYTIKCHHDVLRLLDQKTTRSYQMSSFHDDVVRLLGQESTRSNVMSSFHDDVVRLLGQESTRSNVTMMY